LPDEVAGKTFPEPPAEKISPLNFPPRNEWEKLLRANPVVGQPHEDKPLILDDAGRLYLHRYWKYEQTVADEILQRASNRPSRLMQNRCGRLEKIISRRDGKN
jgi:ATP-dependent exoDNAse (exonuclease V) alpha subunit